MRIDGQSDADRGDPLQSRGAPRAIEASSDIHSPRYLAQFLRSLETREGRACLFRLAGDIVDRGRVEAARPVVNAISSRYPETRIVAVFGNEEYHDLEDKFRRLYPEVDWLDDEYRVYDCGGRSVAVVGTRGALDRLTSWQRRNMPWLERVYRERPRIVAELLDRARSEAEFVVLLSHYGLSRATLRGEDPRIYPYLYSSLMERVVTAKKPDAAIHGHAHKGTPKAIISGVPVYNVAFPLVKSPVTIPLRKARSLEAYF